MTTQPNYETLSLHAGQVADPATNAFAVPVCQTSIAELLAERNVSGTQYVSVELTGEIVDCAQFGDTCIKDGDQIAFLCFMGGGQWN